MKGIILSSGNGTRLEPMTSLYQKQLLPIFDKPMINYAISLLILIKITEIGIVTTQESVGVLKKLYGNGEKLGVSINYIIQSHEKCYGIPYAILLCSGFIKNNDFVVVLGDTILYGAELTSYLEKAKNKLITEHKSVIFETFVSKPEDFGAIVYDNAGKPTDIIEKKEGYRNKTAVPGIYFYANEELQKMTIKEKSARGEYEISDVNSSLLKCGRLEVIRCGRGFLWIDTGTPEAIYRASLLISIIQETTGRMIGCIEEIAFNQGLICKNEMYYWANKFSNSEYGKYIRELIEN